MTTATDRLDLRLSADDKSRLRRAATLNGVSVAAFVRDAALREADAVIAQPPATHGSLAARMRGRLRAPLSTDEIMRLTRDA